MRASSTGKRSASRGVGGLDYKRFDNIVDSDDDDDHTPTVTSPMPDALRDMPPALRLALAKVEAAKEHGSETMVKDAMRELDARLNDMPPSFKRKFLGASSEAAQPPARAKDERREALDKLPPGEAREKLDRKLDEIERAQSSLDALSADPSKLPEWCALLLAASCRAYRCPPAAIPLADSVTRHVPRLPPTALCRPLAGWHQWASRTRRLRRRRVLPIHRRLFARWPSDACAEALAPAPPPPPPPPPPPALPASPAPSATTGRHPRRR